MGRQDVVHPNGTRRVADSDGREPGDLYQDGGPDVDHVDEQYREWLHVLERDVIEGEFGYEPGEFTVYSSHWLDLYDAGLTPCEAWQRALDGYANARRERDAELGASYARIIAEDEAAIRSAQCPHPSLALSRTEGE